MMRNTHIFPDNPSVARAFAKQLVDWLPQDQDTHVALSGGSTPTLLFEVLAQDFHDQINWQKLHLYWVDERCVPPDHADSNYGMTLAKLLSKVPIPAAQVHRMIGEAAPAAEAIGYGELLRSQLPLAGDWPVFDLILLGMGGDGHTASIFPHQIELLTADTVCAVATHPESGQQRITLTGRVLQVAKRVAFLVTGASKAPVLREIFDQQGKWESYPAAHIHPQGELHWFLDEAAAS